MNGLAKFCRLQDQAHTALSFLSLLKGALHSFVSSLNSRGRALLCCCAVTRGYAPDLQGISFVTFGFDKMVWKFLWVQYQVSGPPKMQYSFVGCQLVHLQSLSL